MAAAASTTASVRIRLSSRSAVFMSFTATSKRTVRANWKVVDFTEVPGWQRHQARVPRDTACAGFTPAAIRWERMAKRLMFAVVGLGIGALVGLLVDFAGAGNSAVIVCALLGAGAPMLLGTPGK